MADSSFRADMVTVVLAIAFALAAQEPTEVSVRNDARLEAMARRAGLLKMQYANDKERAAPELLKSPVLRCDDPTRQELDATVWLWTVGKRPVALLSIFERRGKWYYENSTLADEALVVTGRPDWSWQPVAARRTWLSLDEPVPESAAARLRAMRTISRELAASEFYKGQTFQLRLLPTPLYRYADAEQGVIDGGLFALVNGTNPEVLVQLEARGDDRTPRWHLSFARLARAELTVLRAEKEIWKVPDNGEPNPRAGYYTANGPDPLE